MMTSMRVLFVPVRGRPHDYNSHALRRRRALWRDPARNELIRDLAAGLAARPRKTLRTLGVPVGAVELPARRRQRVVVLVESAAHAHRLGESLPAWEVRDVVPVRHGLHDVRIPDVRGRETE